MLAMASVPDVGGQPERIKASSAENAMLIVLWASSLPFVVMELSMIPDVPDWAIYGFRLTVIGFNTCCLLALRSPQQTGSGRTTYIRGVLMWHSISVWIICKCWFASEAIWYPFILAMHTFQVIVCRWFVGSAVVQHVLITLIPSLAGFYMRDLELGSTSGRKLSAEVGGEHSAGEDFIVSVLLLVCALFAGLLAAGYGLPWRQRTSGTLRMHSFDDVLRIPQETTCPELSNSPAAQQAGVATSPPSQDPSPTTIGTLGVGGGTISEDSAQVPSTTVPSDPSDTSDPSEHVPDDGERHENTVDDIVGEGSKAHGAPQRMLPTFLPEGTPGYDCPEYEVMFPGAVPRETRGAARQSQDQDEGLEEHRTGHVAEDCFSALFRNAASVKFAVAEPGELDREDSSSEKTPTS